MKYVSYFFRGMAFGLIIAITTDVISPVFFQYVHAANTTYYIDPISGDDANSGTGKTSAWKTLAKASSFTGLEATDSVRLKCGAIFSNETLVLTTSGITYGGYDATNDFCTVNNLPTIVVNPNTQPALHNGGVSLSQINIQGLVFSGTALSGIYPIVALTNSNQMNISSSVFYGVSSLSGVTNSTFNGNTFIDATVQFNDGNSWVNNVFNHSILTNMDTTKGLNTSVQFNLFASGSQVRISGMNSTPVGGESAFLFQSNTLQQSSMTLTDVDGLKIDTNAFFNEKTIPLTITRTASGNATNNTLSNNTFYARDIYSPMILVNEFSGQNGLNFAGSYFHGVYKVGLPYVQFRGINPREYFQADIKILDATATTFQSFGYKNYISTGSTYAGMNLISNNTFDVDTSNWSVASNATLGYVSSGSIGTGPAMSITSSASSGSVVSSSFPLSAGAKYEISMNLKNTVLGSREVNVIVADPVNGDKILPLIVSSSGKYLLDYFSVASSSTNASLKIEVLGTGASVEVDNIKIQPRNALILNTEVNEVYLFSNRSSTYLDVNCPSDAIACTEYVNKTNATVYFPTSLDPYEFRIVSWNKSPNTLNTPICQLTTPDTRVPNGNPISVSWVTNGDTNFINYETASGVLDYAVANTGTVSFVPKYNVTTTITVRSTNNVGTSSQSIGISSDNYPPNVVPFSATIAQDTILTGQLVATDSTPGSTITFVKRLDPTLGTVMIASDGSFIYTPYPATCGTDEFRFTAKDDSGLMASDSNAIITIICSDAAPVVNNDLYTVSGGTTRALNVMGNDILANQNVTASIYSFTQPTHGTTSLGAGGMITYIGNDAYYDGTDSFQYSILDSQGKTSNTGTVNITVKTINVPPIAYSGSHTLNEDQMYLSGVVATDGNNDPLTYTIIQNVTHGTLNLNNNNFTYTPSPNYFGSDYFTYQVSDGRTTSTVARVDLTILSVPDIPKAVDDTINIPANSGAFLAVMNNDSDDDEMYVPQKLQIHAYTPPSHGTLSLNGTGFDYMPNLNYSGSDIFTYTIHDIDGNISNTGTVNIIVNLKNDPPIAFSGAFTTLEDTPLVNHLQATDPDGTLPTFLVDQAPLHGTLVLNATGSFTYTPNPNYNGTDYFTFHAHDGIVGSNIERVDITILSVNDAPVTQADSVSGNKNRPLSIDVLANDSDADGDALRIFTFTGSLFGQLALSGNTIIYTPDFAYCGNDSFNYSVVDTADAVSNISRVDIVINCANNPPISSNQTIAITGNNTGTGNFLSNRVTALDYDRDPLSFSLASSPASGILVFSGSGIYTYTPKAGFSGNDNFSYTVSDGTDTSGPYTITLQVELPYVPSTTNIGPGGAMSNPISSTIPPIVITSSGSLPGQVVVNTQSSITGSTLPQLSTGSTLTGVTKIPTTSTGSDVIHIQTGAVSLGIRPISSLDFFKKILTNSEFDTYAVRPAGYAVLREIRDYNGANKEEIINDVLSSLGEMRIGAVQDDKIASLAHILQLIHREKYILSHPEIADNLDPVLSIQTQVPPQASQASVKNTKNTSVAQKNILPESQVIPVPSSVIPEKGEDAPLPSAPLYSGIVETVLPDSVKFYSSKTSASLVVGILLKNEIVSVMWQDKDWSKVDTRQGVGYIRTKYISDSMNMIPSVKRVTKMSDENPLHEASSSRELPPLADEQSDIVDLSNLLIQESIIIPIPYSTQTASGISRLSSPQDIVVQSFLAGI